MKVDSKNTALVVTDPQNDFLSPEGVTWGMVGKNVTHFSQSRLFGYVSSVS